LAVNDALHRTLNDLADFLDGQGVRFAVIGGIAAGARGEPRFTADVVSVVGADLDRALALVNVLEGSPFRPLFPDVAEVVRTAFILPVRHRETQIKVDLAIGLTGFERQLLDRATQITLTDRVLPVATAEDLILLKVLAGRPRDMEDIAGIVARQANALDWNYLFETAQALQVSLTQDIVSPLRKLQTAEPPPD